MYLKYNKVFIQVLTQLFLALKRSIYIIVCKTLKKEGRAF